MTDPDDRPGEPSGIRDDLERMLAFPAKLIPTLARWAKMAMTLQSIVSLGTVVLVVARAVNILK